MSFNLTEIPTGASVVSAKVFSNQCAVVGSPIPGLGDVLLEHVNYGQTADTSAFDTPVLDSTGGLFSADETLGPRSRTVTASVLADQAAGRGTTQFRLQMSEFNNTNDSTNDYVAFQAPSGANHDVCSAPVVRQGTQLIISYKM
jgi:hypothetical protein